ncbi:MAG: hypothetical protein ACOYID_06370 [Eubacteriales bacterium]
MKKRATIAIAAAAILFVLAGCGALPAESCLDYRSSPFVLEGRLDCDGREYTISVEFTADETLKVKANSPERIAGCVVTLPSGGGAALEFGGITVTVAEKEDMQNYGALAALRELVLPPEEGLLSVELVKLGNHTYNLAVFENPRGKVSVWFDKRGIPVRFGADGVTLSVTAFEKKEGTAAETEAKQMPDI